MATKLSNLTDHELLTAATWLRCNEGPDGEAQACEEVAHWLEAEVERRSLNRAARSVARKAGVRFGYAKKVLLKKAEGGSSASQAV